MLGGMNRVFRQVAEWLSWEAAEGSRLADVLGNSKLVPMTFLFGALEISGPNAVQTVHTN